MLDPHAGRLNERQLLWVALLILSEGLEKVVNVLDFQAHRLDFTDACHV